MPVPDNEIVKMFQRYLGSSDSREIDKLDAQELAAAEARLRLGGTNPDFTAVLKAQIARLEQIESRKHESKVRALNLVTGLVLGLIIAGVSAWAFGA